ncbi:MAG TPA: hypothetical protein VGM79_17705 [Streptosporangiaceae bacterium]|jgi:hypothetical protein
MRAAPARAAPARAAVRATPVQAGLPPAVAPTAVLSARFARSFDIAVVVVVAGWHIAGAGSELFPYRGLYRSFPVQFALWLVIALAIAAGALRLLGGRSRPAWSYALAAVALAVTVAGAVGCPAGQLLRIDWAWGTAGWVGLLVLLRRPVRELVVFLMLNGLATFAVLAHDGLHRADVAGFITILAETTAIQLVVAVAARQMGATAREAAEVTRVEAAARQDELIAERLRVARQARWLALQETAGPLLRELAAGSADPADPEVRRSCAVEAARLRRLMAESDDAAGPLVHELHACADVAERRGVAVDIETVGALPSVPAEVRRVITDTAIAILTTAVSQVRVTLTALREGIAVSLVADSPAPPPPQPAAALGVVIDHDRDRHSLWVEARWTR